MWCESEGLNRGSRFIIELQALDADGGAPASVGPDEPQAGAVSAAGGHRILVVDDTEDAALMLQAALEQLGHSVEVAADGPSALARAQGGDLAIVLLDIGLPMMDGYEVAWQLRARTETDHLHLIAVTGYGQDADRSAGARTAAEDLVIPAVTRAAAQARPR